MSSEMPVCSQLAPVFVDAFSSNELDELMTLIHSGFPTHSPSGSEISQNGLVLRHSHSTSGSETTRPVYSPEERKRRRKISNRESAKRSRWRKKQQLEELTSQLNRLKQENRDLKNHLFLHRHQYQAVQRDSARLMVESMDYQQKLASLHQILANVLLQ